MGALRALLLLGPTASGKTALSLELAQTYPIEIISVDSALVYRNMDIGTAKPSLKERSVCPHHLIDVREISEAFSAADFATESSKLIDEIRSRGKIPLIVGGTMLYAKALREGIDELPPTDESIREEVLSEIRDKGLAALREELMRVDPECAKKLAPADTQRIARALEVYRMTGRPITSFQKGKRAPDATLSVIGLMPSDRARLHQDIGKRFDAMMQCGFLDEVRNLMARSDFSKDLPSMRSVGYRQAIEFLEGNSSEAEFLEAAKAATRQLAKRQMTWLRSMPEVEFFDSHVEDKASFYARVNPILKEILQGL